MTLINGFSWSLQLESSELIPLTLDETPFSRRLHNLLGNEIEDSNFLILDRVELLPKYRGNGVGLLVLRSLIELEFWLVLKTSSRKHAT